MKINVTFLLLKKMGCYTSYFYQHFVHKIVSVALKR